MARRFYAVGTYADSAHRPTTAIVARAIVRIAASQKPDGTWGGPDSLDQFITTCHCVMTLLASGVNPDSKILKGALDMLSGLSIDRQTTFFYRAGPMLNLPGYERIVEHDIQHLARTSVRAGGNPYYPAPFFLLKLLRFSAPPRDGWV